MTKNSAALPTRRRSRRTQQNDLTENNDARDVFRLLRNRSFGTRTEVERLFNLSPSRFRAAVTHLLRNGLLVAPHQDGQDAAQRPVFPRANAGYGHVVGVDIGGSNLRIALADMSGTILGKWSASTKQTSSPRMVIAQIRDGVSETLRATSVPRSCVLTSPGTRCAAARITAQVTGLRLCGIVEEPPRPSPLGSNSSATSVCVCKEISRAILPRVPIHRPSVVATSVRRSRCECQGAAGKSSFSSWASVFATVTPVLPSAASVPT